MYPDPTDSPANGHVHIQRLSSSRRVNPSNVLLPSGTPTLRAPQIPPSSVIPFIYTRSSPRGPTRRPIPGTPGLHHHPRAATAPLMRAPAPLLCQEVRGCTRIKVLLENLAPREAAERHGADRTAAPTLLASLGSEDTDREPAPSPAPETPPPPGDQSCPGTPRGPPPEDPPLPGNQSDQSSGFLLPEARPLQPSQQALPIDAS